MKKKRRRKSMTFRVEYLAVFPAMMVGTVTTITTMSMATMSIEATILLTVPLIMEDILQRRVFVLLIMKLY